MPASETGWLSRGERKLMPSVSSVCSKAVLKDLFVDLARLAERRSAPFARAAFRQTGTVNHHPAVSDSHRGVALWREEQLRNN